ncbi:MAG: phenylalanine--tRNA ligase subunit alpha [Bacillota bacterium]
MDLNDIKTRALKAVKEARSLDDLESARRDFLGRKGDLTVVLRSLGHASPEERPRLGREANEIRGLLEEAIARKTRSLKDEASSGPPLDVTLPGDPPSLGRAHPLRTVLREIEEIFMGLGFEVVEGPEVEFDYYNFVALNFPKGHPARDMQSSFKVSEEVLLRTHTSPVQIRVMEERAPGTPLKVIAPGRVFRRDDDATHSPMFHQIEGLAVGEGITMGDLKGVLLAFAKRMYGEDAQVRFRPSYFPFTEPSAEVDISCSVCMGKGCRTCGDTGWQEILGSGMVHPQVLRNGGYDPEAVTGFAFGMGLERVAMLKYGIDDLRLFFGNDMRFLAQF